MPEYTGGETMHIRIVHSGGTTDIQDQVRSSKLRVNGNLIDTTAGSQAWKTFIGRIKEWGVEIEALHNGTEAPMGAADLTALVFGANGTITLSPNGTAVGRPRHTGAFVVESREVNWPYEDLATIRVTLRGNGALTESNW